MRQIIIAAVVYCILNLFIPKLWERVMSEAPPIVVNVITFVATLACVAFVACADPVLARLKNPSENPLSSTVLIAALTAATIGAAWWIFAVPPPKAKGGGPPITIVKILVPPPYEAGKPLRIAIEIINTSAGLRMRGRHHSFIAIMNEADLENPDKRIEWERELWRTYEEEAQSATPIPLSSTVGLMTANLTGPILTEKDVEGIKNKNAVIYLMGQLDYGGGALEYCGFLETGKPDQERVTLCIEHNGPVPKAAFK